jgi:hypothetical protein
MAINRILPVANNESWAGEQLRNQTSRAYRLATSSDNAYAYKGEDNETYVVTYNPATDTMVSQRLRQYNYQRSVHDVLVFDSNDNLYTVWENGNGTPNMRVHKWTRPTGGWATALRNNAVDTIYTTATVSGNREGNMSSKRLNFVSTTGGDYLVYTSARNDRSDSTSVSTWCAISIRCSDLSKVDEIHPWWGGIGPDAFTNAWNGDGRNNRGYVDVIHTLQPRYGSNKIWQWFTGKYPWAGDPDACGLITVGTDGKMTLAFNNNQGQWQGIVQEGQNYVTSVIPINGDNLFMLAYDQDDNGHPVFKAVQLNNGPTENQRAYLGMNTWIKLTDFYTLNTAVADYDNSDYRTSPFIEWYSSTSQFKVWMPGNDGKVYSALLNYNIATNTFTRPAGYGPALFEEPNLQTTGSNNNGNQFWMGSEVPRNPVNKLFFYLSNNGRAGVAVETPTIPGLIPTITPASPIEQTVNLTPGVDVPLNVTASATLNLWWGTGSFSISNWTTYKLRRVFGATTQYYNASSDVWQSGEVSNTWAPSVTLKASQFTNGTQYTLALSVGNAQFTSDYSAVPKVFTPVAALAAPSSPTPRSWKDALIPIATDAHLFTVDNRTLINKVTFTNNSTSNATVSMKVSGVTLLAPLTLTANQTVTYETSQLAYPNDKVTVSNTGSSVDVYVTGTEGI